MMDAILHEAFIHHQNGMITFWELVELCVRRYPKKANQLLNLHQEHMIQLKELRAASVSALRELLDVKP